MFFIHDSCIEGHFKIIVIKEYAASPELGNH